MSDKLMRRTLIVCAGVLVLCGLPMVVLAVVQRDARMGLYGVLSLLFALSNVLQACIVRRPECPKPVAIVVFETHGDGADGTGHWVRIGTLKADTVQNGVIPYRSNHQERHEILRVESFDGDVKAVQSFLNEHDAGYIAEVTPEQPIIVEALGNKACVYVTKIVQCELRDILRLLEAK
ncbi:peptide ABC transporter permease [Bifidobacterium longum]|uniref:peptide ABC transporter permease n=1 Tax=Bifidobacterium longum TaxID=216816 RepID=UPI00319EB74F